MNVILDTNVVFSWNNNVGRGQKLIREHGITQLFITTVTYIEVLGAAQIEDKIWARKFLKSFNILPFGASTQLAAEFLCMRHVMRRKEAADFLIACVAREHDFTVVTDNLKDFAFKDDVAVIEFSAVK